jgi:hypothetical protein
LFVIPAPAFAEVNSGVNEKIPAGFRLGFIIPASGAMTGINEKNPYANESIRDIIPVYPKGDRELKNSTLDVHGYAHKTIYPAKAGLRPPYIESERGRSNAAFSESRHLLECRQKSNQKDWK